MRMRSLRKFLYLDTDTITDYLAALEGSVLVGPVEETQQETVKKGAGANAKFLKADLGSEGLTQTHQKRAFNPAAQFQHLCDLLESKDAIQFLESFDEAIWNQLEKGEILEIEAGIRLPEALVLAQGVRGLPSLVKMFEPFKDFLDTGEGTFEETQSQVNMISGFGELANTNEILVLFEAVGNPDFHFTARLSRQYLLCDLLDLQGEAVVFGKIQRFIEQGQSETVFSLDHGLDALTAYLNRKQRRALAKKSPKVGEGFVEMLGGPGLILFPIAIYR